MKERRDLLGQNELFSEAIGSDRAFGGLDNIIGINRDLSALPIALKRIATTLALEALIKRAEGNSLRNSSRVAVKTLHMDSNSGKCSGESS